MNNLHSANLQYRIRVTGHLQGDWVDWPCRIETTQTFNGTGIHPVTELIVWLPDQSALHGVLEKIRDMNLTLISLSKE